MEQDKKRWAQRTKSYEQINHGKNQWRLLGYKAEFLKSNPEPTSEYYVSNVVSNYCLKIEDDEHPLYRVKGNSGLSVLVFNNKVQNLLILYLQGKVSTRNLGGNILKLKEPWTEKKLESIQFIFQPDLLYSNFHFPKEVAD